MKTREELKYWGEVKGLKTGKVTRDRLNVASSDEYAWHSTFNQEHFNALLQDEQDTAEEWKVLTSMLRATDEYAVLDGMYYQVHSHTNPNNASWKVIIANDGFRRAELITGVKFVKELPPVAKPKTLHEAKRLQELQAYNSLSTSQAARHGVR